MSKRRKEPAVPLPPLPRVLVPHPHVRSDIHVLGGSPHIEGTRVPVRRLWSWHRSGATVETLLKRYPRLGAARVLDALAFAYDNREVMEADLAREMAAFEAAGEKPLGVRPMEQQAFGFMESDDDGG
jgi:uncharacterized protein (DUF433 family)